MRLKFATLISSILFICGFAMANPDPAPEVILVDDAPTRHFIVANHAINELLLQDLKPGKWYKAFLSAEQTNCQPTFVGAGATAKGVLSFQANAAQKTIKLKQDCGPNTTLRFSIACTDCETAQFNSLMGIIADENFSPDELIRDVFIAGDCFNVSEQSISFSGDPLGRGYFSNGENSINIEEGVILATGNIHNSAGPNNVYNTGSSFFNFGADPDLAQMINSQSIYDIAALEFDFTPTTDQVSFEFVFASEEYCEYVNSNFNDVFGFFISGPGINGPFSNGAENIALVPNTNDYTAINTVNHLVNPAYYVNNIPVSQHDVIPDYLQCLGYPTTTQGVAVNNIEYDGFTTVMTAMANVQACETYHIKLIIADVSDGYFDSAVFLKANSFAAGDLATVSSQAQGGVDTNVAFEGCQDGYFIFARATDDLTEDLTINFSIDPASTATAGEDYSALPESITIPAGDSVFYLPVAVYEDQWTESMESIILQLDAPCSCDIPYVELFIEELTPLYIDIDDAFSCGPAAINLEPVVDGGWGGYDFNWQTGDTTAQLDIWAETDTMYTLIVTDECGNTATASMEVLIVEEVSAMISGNVQLCPGNTMAQLPVTFTGNGPWDIVYSIDNVAQTPINDIVTNPFYLETSALGTYQLVSVSTQGCPGMVEGTASITLSDLSVELNASDESCPEAEDGSIIVQAAGGTPPYAFSWNNGLGTIENPGNLAAGMYELTLTDQNNCSIVTSVEVMLHPDVPSASAGANGMLDCSNTSISLAGTASEGSTYTYLWTTADGNIVTGENTLNPLVDETGTYNLSVTNMMTGCVVTDKTEVFIDTISPEAAINLLGPQVLNCSEPVTVLDASASVPFNSLEFDWTTTDGNILSGPTTVNPEVNAQGVYELLVTNTTNGCTDTETIFIGANLELPTVIIQTPNPLTCIDSIINLDAGNSSSGSNYDITWTSPDGNIITGENTLFPTVDQPGNYSMTIFNTSNDCENTASVLVTEDRVTPIAEAGLPTELDCNDQTAVLDASLSSTGTNYIYDWSSITGTIENGANSLNPEVQGPGIYELLVTNIRNGCTASDEVLALEAQNVPTNLEVELFEPQCYGDEGAISILSVEGGVGPYLYSIDDGENFYNENLFLNLQPGQFQLTVQDAEGCQYMETVEIPNVPELIVELAQEVEVELGDTYQIEALVNIPEFLLDTIFWSPNENLSCSDCLDPVAFPLQSTTYQILVTDQNGCPATAKILLRVDKNRRVYIPNAFSPDSDGVNDRFLIYAKEGLVRNISNFQIFNRWGGKVFEVSNAQPNDPFFGWDGMDKGEIVNPAVFIYFAEIEFIDGEKRIYKGDVTVTN